MRSTEAVTRIFEIIDLGQHPVNSDIPYQSFGIGPLAINIIGGDNLLEFNDLVNFLHSHNREILNSFSRKSFLESLINFIGPKKCAGILPKEVDVQKFYSALRQIELKPFRVIRDIRGITLSDQSNVFRLGNFKIYHFRSERENFERVFGDALHIMLIPQEPEYLIEYEVESREEVRAIEIADEHFKKFVLFLRHMIGTSDDRFEVGILNYSGWQIRNAHVIYGNKFSVNAQGHGSFEPIPIDNQYFRDVELGYAKLWELIDGRTPNKLEKRITTAVEWIGRSLIEKNIQTAFIEASVALESIFTYNEKSIITPSILSQITESVALLLGNDVEQKIAIEKQLKDCYSIRSGIVHAGDKEVASEDYNLFVHYIRSVIIKLLTDENYTSCSTVEELYAKLKVQKYS